MNSILSAIVSGLNFFPGIKTKLAAVLSVISALIVAVSAAVAQFGVSIPYLYLNEINAVLIALTAVGASNQPANAKT